MKEIIQIQSKFNRIFEFSRDKDGNKQIAISDFPNYFYVKDSDLDLVLHLIETKIERKFANEFVSNTPKVYSGFTSLYNEKISKIVPNKFEFWKIRKLLWDEKINTYEYTLDVYLKYLLSLNNPKFSTKRKVGIIDIETDMSLDAENAPKPINAITIYNYEDLKFYTWILKNKNNDEIAKREKENEVLFIFDNDCEDDMLKHFIDKFKEFDFDVVGGWNSMDYDFPYIINRLNVLGLNANNLSRFYEYEEDAVYARKFELYTKKGKRTHFDCQILGVELVDFIPILQKNVCYKPQPSSWSLKSTANFYLGEQHQKLVKIGAGAWETNINDFITYNIKDVDVVRELIDAFKLIDFFIMIQTEIAPVPLKHVTHNSVVLLYYLKFLHPEKIYLDNPGYKKIENEYVDLTKNRIKMKAAHVVEPVAGLHENVSILDFAGLYPSIFRTFNISPETLSSDGVEIDDIVMWKMGSLVSSNEDDEDDDEPDKNEIIQEWQLTKKYAQQEKGLYPSLLKNLVDKRNVNKSLAKEYKKLYGEKDFRTILQESRGDVLKQIANSLYGVNGFNKTILFNPIIGASVTSISRKLIKHVKEKVDSKDGFKVLTGDSVSGDTTILIKYKNKNMLIKIEDMLDIIPNKKTNRTDKDVYIFLEDVYTQSYNFNTKKTEFKKIKQFIRHTTNKNKYNVTSKNYCFNVTEDHGFYGINNNLISVKEYPEKARHFDIFNPPKCSNEIKINFSNKIKEINLLDISKKCIDYYTTQFKQSKILFEKDNKCFYLKYIDRTGKMYKTLKFPIKIKLDKDFGYALGAYIAEGSVSRDGWSGFRIAAGDTKYIKKVFNILVKIFGNKMIHLNDYNTRIVGGNYIISNLFKELSGYQCHRKKLPNFILDTNKNFFLSILAGYMPGDGFHLNRSDNMFDYLNLAGVGSKSKLLVSQIYFIMKNIFKLKDEQIRIRYRVDKNFYGCSWNTKVKKHGSCIQQNKYLVNDFYNEVYDLEVEDNHNFIDVLGGVILHNTDSLMIRHPKDLDVMQFEKEVNEQIKNFVFEKFPNINKENYCLNFEYAKTYSKYVMKDAKKKYYGILMNGDFNCKGFCIIQHVLSPKIKEWIKEIYIRLMNREQSLNIKARIAEIKREFYKLNEKDLYQEIKLANNPDTYTTKVHQAEAAQYSNTYLGTNFKGGDSGKLVYIKLTADPKKYPKTEYVFLDEDTSVPNELLIDYERSWEKLFIDNIKILEGIPEFDIDTLVNKNTKLCNFF